MRKTILLAVSLLINPLAFPGQPVQIRSSEGPAVPDTSKLISLLYRLDLNDAADYLTQYLESLPASNEMQLASSWLDLAIIRARSGKIIESRAAFFNYSRLSAKQPDSPQLKANRLLYRSLQLDSEEMNNQAADSLVASITVRPVGGTLNLILLADSYGKLARWYKKTGDLFESSRNFERSIGINRRIGRNVFLAEDLSDLSSVLTLLNIFDPRADSALFESLSYYQKAKDLKAISEVYNELGVLYSRRGNFKESINYFKKSRLEKFLMKDSNPEDFIAVTNNIGHCFKSLGNSDSARFYFLKAVELAKLAKKNPASYYANLGILDGETKEYDNAIGYFQKALHSLDSISCSLTDFSTNPRINQVTPQLADFTAFKAHTFRRKYNQTQKKEDLIIGLKTFLVALSMMDTLRFMYSFESKPYLLSEAKIHFFYALDMALDLYKLTGEKKYLEQAFQLSDRNKSAILNEFLRTNQAREYMGNVAPWIIVEDSIKQLINNIESERIKITTTTNLTDSILSLQNRISDLTNQLKNIGIMAKTTNPEFFKIVYSGKGYLPEEIQRLILPGEALIDYTIVRDSRLKLDNIIVIVLTRDTLFTYRNTLPNSFREEIGAFRGSITSYIDAKVFQEFCKLSNRMYQYFIAPIEKFSRISRLIILPDEELGFLPFEVFVSDTIKPRGSDFRRLSYLNRKYQISYISSHEQFFQFRTYQGKRKKSTVYVFAPFATAGARIGTLDLPKLEYSGNEIRYASRFFRTKAFTDKKAGEESLRRAFTKESVIAISTHGVMDPEHPMQSRICLNPFEKDGNLYLFELMAIKIRSPLVILNACNTGSGELQIGEGVMSMARGFQFAGVSSVVTSLWPIDDQSSSTVMKFFFQNLHNGMDQREALMKARNSYIDQANKASAAPYFWAGQVLIGNPGKIAIHQQTNFPFLLISLFIVALILASILVIRKKTR